MIRLPSPLKALLAAAGVTLAQIALAVLLLAPEGPLSYRYTTLNQHDSYWFMNIVNRGYQTIVPPINHKTMEVSNVAFFPAYPLSTTLVSRVFNMETENALLVTAQIAAFGFWAYFFLFCQRWNVPPLPKWLGALAILAHPAAFFLVAGYSESMFLMALLGFVYWSGSNRRRDQILAVLHGAVMSATRIVGIPCAIIPLVQAALTEGLGTLRRPIKWARAHAMQIAVSILAMSGAVLFFIFCQLRWGHWDLYMLTQSAGWGIVPDYLAVVRPSSYHWLVPALNNPTEASQLCMSLTAVLFVLIAIGELVPALRRRTNWQQRIGFYFAGAVVYYISVSGVACVDMESMLRYQFCTHALIVLAFLHFLRQFRLPPAPVRALGVAAVVLLCAAGLSLQGWYIWNFTRGNWVA